METRLFKTTGYAFCLFGLFFFCKNIPFLWYLNSVSHANQLYGLNLQEEYLFWLKFGISYLVSVVFPFFMGCFFLSKNRCSNLSLIGK
jgi:hypothetical protein